MSKNYIDIAETRLFVSLTWNSNFLIAKMFIDETFGLWGYYGTYKLFRKIYIFF